ncbi:hypothetical protein JoomaDRAFT_0277 [Galbibacter orientalis DSM 19592]|uniref:Uncharacterized protein n=1 Tax=Galbibacter orientalis DSM 19592 TaxID=926559 RepID=I3C141_9FLAO|nr:hypothetical protein JoomaDRAFT_0277 [Galbibacter orientalis DSM 19592]
MFSVEGKPNPSKLRRIFKGIKLNKKTRDYYVARFNILLNL